MQSDIEEPDSTVNAGEKSEESFPVSVNWTEGMQFVATDEHNHAIVLDTNREAGGRETGPTPGRLLLMAVASCTAMDVIDILRKSRQKVTGLSVLSRSVKTNVYPKYYKEIYLKYIFKGKQLDKARVERAIKLSEEKYCPVGATVKGKAEIFFEYEIVNED